tara:strand:+ start:11237 stop:13651 length:2415 start_codon:yes stop_codon:yes gene_type:complete
LRRAWEAVVQGESQAVLLRGEAGLGKSRLIRAFKAKIARGARSSVQWHCSSLYQSTANFPAREQLRHLLRANTEGDARALERLRGVLRDLRLDVDRYVPVLARLVGIASPKGAADDLPPDRLKQETVQAQIELVIALSAQRPVLYVVEDLHWADPTTLEVLHRMIVACRDKPVLFLMTGRPEFEPTWEAESHAQTHRLHNLSRRDTTEFVQNLIGDESLWDAAVAQIIDRADGIPLFVEEVTKHLLAADGNAAVPSSLRDSLTARLNRLGDSREVAQAAAVIGRNFTLDALQALVARSRDSLAAAVEQLQSDQLVHVRMDGTYEFRHALFRDTTYDSLLRDNCRRLHRAYVDYLSAQDDQNAPPELRARHLQEAGDTLATVHAWERAGDHSSEESAQAEAARQYKHAIDLYASLGVNDQSERYELDVLLKLGQAQVGAVGGAAPETASTFRRAAELSERVGSLEEKCRSFYGQHVVDTIAGQSQLSLETAQAFLRKVEPLGVDWARGSTLRLLSTSQLLVGDLRGALATLKEVLRLRSAIEAGPGGFGHDPAITAVSNLTHVEWAMVRPDASIQLSNKNHAELDVSRVNPNTVCHTLVWRVLLGIFRNDPDLVERSASELDQFTRRSGGRFWANMLLWGIGICEIRAGDAERGVKTVKRGAEGFMATGSRQHIPVAFQVTSGGYLLQGDVESALLYASKVETMCYETQQFFYKPESLRLKARALLATGERSEAQATLEQALTLVREQGASSLELRTATDLSRLLQDLGDVDQARVVLQKPFAAAAEGHDLPDYQAAQALLQTLT